MRMNPNPNAVQNAMYPGGYATDSSPITASGKPAQAAAMFAEQNGIDFTDHNLEKLEALAKEAIADWSKLPDYERAEWNGVEELMNYYMRDGFREMDTGTTDDIYNRLNEDYDHFEELRSRKFSDENIADYYSHMWKTPRDSTLSAVRRMWQGGKVEGQMSAGATPDDGDSITYKGQTVYYRNGQWEYKRGSKAPAYILKHIQQSIAPEVVNNDISSSDTNNSSGDNSSGGYDLKEAEAKNFGWAKRAIEAEKVIQELIASGYNPSSYARTKQEAVAGLLGDADVFRDEKGQRFRRAVSAFAQAILRKDTGAQISTGEMDWTLTNFFPGFGTKKNTQADLANQRKNAIESFIVSSGPAAAELNKELTTLYGEKGEVNKSASDAPIFTGEDWGGIIGGTAGAIGGGLLGGPIGAAGGGAGGAYLGRAAGQYFSTDDSLIESLSPEANDVIDTILGGVGGGAGKAASAGYKATKAAIIKAAKKDGVSTISGLANIARRFTSKKNEGGMVGYNSGGGVDKWQRDRFIRKLLEEVKPGSRDEARLLKRLGINPKTRKNYGGLIRR